jgi:tetratricopeptide (TPR) repeat protein
MSAGEDLAKLRVAVRNEPLNGELRYLLGAELAENRDYEQAVVELSTALQLQPALHTARFQLGLLHLTLARPDEALAVLAPLGALPADAPLRLFKQALEALVRDDFAACVRELEQGIAANTSNPALNQDMTLLLGKARLALAQPAVQPAEDDDADAVRTDFSLYSQTRQ